MYSIGDRVVVVMHSRTMGYDDTGGGWTTDFIHGEVLHVDGDNVTVWLDECYFGHDHTYPSSRMILESKFDGSQVAKATLMLQAKYGKKGGRRENNNQMAREG